ncbi:MAG TPA: hypothetical protein VHX37_17760 [Acidobacteriaceae bacterium]|jgi:hypothetical protein|nr:hypothetical protein [Acidobacteriaceae bacterium]
MEAAHKADPATYAAMRRHALEMRLTHAPRQAVQSVLMDWHVDRGTVTVLATADGTASLYLSSGGGFLGGGQRYEEIRQVALHAVALATSLASQFEPTEMTALPALGDVTFYVTSGEGIRMVVASEARLRAGTDPLAALGGAMQRIVTEYRVHYPRRPAAAEVGEPAVAEKSE